MATAIAFADDVLTVALGQVRVDGQVQSRRTALHPAQKQMPEVVEADCSELEGLLHCRMQVRKLEALQQAKNLHELTPAMLCHAAFHQAAHVANSCKGAA